MYYIIHIKEKNSSSPTHSSKLKKRISTWTKYQNNENMGASNNHFSQMEKLIATLKCQVSHNDLSVLHVLLFVESIYKYLTGFPSCFWEIIAHVFYCFIHSSCCLCTSVMGGIGYIMWSSTVWEESTIVIIEIGYIALETSSGSFISHVKV